MIWIRPESVVQLTTQVTLKAGDLMFAATPAVVGAAVPGDSILSISTPLTIAIGKPAFFLALIDLPSQPFCEEKVSITEV